MGIQLIESFTWVDSSTAGKTALNTRYNSPTLPANYLINNGGGRFAGNALQLTGSDYKLNYYGGAMGPRVVFGVAVKFTGSTLGNNAAIIQLFQSSTGVANEQVSVRFALDGRLTINRVGTVLATGTQVLQSNTFYYIEFAVFFDGAAGTADIYINGVLDASVAGVNTQPQATAVTGSMSLQNTASPFFCDLYGMDGTVTPLGPQRVSLKAPNADGSLQDWAPSAGNAFDCVDTIPPDGDANGFISSATPTDNSTFLFGALPYAPAVVNAVQVSLYARFDDGGPHLVAAVVISGATTDIAAPQSIAANYLDFYLTVYETDPDTGVAWTAAAVDAAEYGVNLDT